MCVFVWKGGRVRRVGVGRIDVLVLVPWGLVGRRGGEGGGERRACAPPPGGFFCLCAVVCAVSIVTRRRIELCSPQEKGKEEEGMFWLFGYETRDARPSSRHTQEEGDGEGCLACIHKLVRASGFGFGGGGRTMHFPLSNGGPIPKKRSQRPRATQGGQKNTTPRACGPLSQPRCFGFF